jgi:hypothetical protein
MFRVIYQQNLASFRASYDSLLKCLKSYITIILVTIVCWLCANTLLSSDIASHVLNTYSCQITYMSSMGNFVGLRQEKDT